MTWRVVLSHAAAHDLRRLDRKTADRVTRAVARLAETGRDDVTRLRADDPEWRLRVGDWRVRLLFDYEDRAITVLRVLPRGRAYRD